MKQLTPSASLHSCSETRSSLSPLRERRLCEHQHNTRIPRKRKTRRRNRVSIIPRKRKARRRNRISIISYTRQWALLALLAWTTCFYMNMVVPTFSGDGLFRKVKSMRTLQTTSLVDNSIGKKSTACWENNFDVVHVVQTRFQQYQPNLVHLGLARLELFRSITLPSMLNQKNHQFLWIIRTDPDLHREVKEPLIEAIQRAPKESNLNLVLVASNKNPENFREKESIADISNQSIWAGSNFDVVKNYHQAAQSRVVLETRLDADDALFFDFIAQIQHDAFRKLHAAEPQIHGNNAQVNIGDKHSGIMTSSEEAVKPAWLLWCVDKHVEWQHYSPWKEQVFDNDIGSIFLTSDRRCATPGLTWGSQVGASRNIPTLNHYKLHKFVSKCARDNTTKNRRHRNCMVRFDPRDGIPLAFRARTPSTSAGMGNVVMPGASSADQWLYPKKIKGAQERFWSEFPPLFGIDTQKLIRTRGYLESHFIEIVNDAINGQCTKGHSCKEQSRQALAMLVARHNNTKHGRSTPPAQNT